MNFTKSKLVKHQTSPSTFAARTRIAIVAVALTWATACAGANKGTGASGASDIDVKHDARLLQMADARKLDTMLVDTLLADPNSARRARATLAIGQVKGKARYARLRALLLDADTAVAANAAFALGLAHDTNAVIPLAKAVAGAPDPVAIEAAWSLGDLGEVARPVLLLSLGQDQSDPRSSSTASQRSAPVRVALITAVSKLQRAPVAVLLPWMNDADPRVVRATAYVLGRTRAVGGIRAMLAASTSADEETRQHVARALVKTSTGDSLSKRAQDALRALIADTSARVRVNAARSLATFGVTSKDALMNSLHDRDGNVRVATAEVIGPLLGTDATAWRTAWSADTTLPVRISILTEARRAGVNALADGEATWQKSADWRQRSAVIQARRADALHPPQLADIAWGIRDTDGRVRTVGVTALLDVVRRHPSAADTVRKLLMSLLDDPDIGARAGGMAGLRTSASAADVPRVLQVYAKSATDGDNDARLAAISYIAAAWQRDSVKFDASLRQQLAALAGPRDSVIRAAARTVTPFAGWRAASTAPAARPLADYEILVRKYVEADAKPLTAVIHTANGDVVIALASREAPLTVDNFVQLARRGYYRNTYWHRVVPNFVAQDGDPRGDGSGGPGYAIRDELNRLTHTRGSLAMALSGPDTGGSQYYLCHSPQPHLDGHYTVFGHILRGYDVLDRIVQGDRIQSIEIK
ncbi:MAG: peptidylprolyl isomerase [Gemmatimonadaceae bacterium]